jgi:hypothetical protein
MKLERSKPEDAKECIEWLGANLALNDCSPRTLKGCTFFKIAGILYLPVKPVLLLESLGPNPAVTGTKRLLALRRAMDDLQKLHPNVDLVFLARKGQRLNKCARSYGFEEMPYAVYRLASAAEDRKREKKIEPRIAEVPLRHDAGRDGAADTLATRTLRRVSGTLRAGTETVRRSHQGDQDHSGNPVQIVQSDRGVRL